jgi:hypothetical protein
VVNIRSAPTRLEIKASMHSILQVLSLTLFETTPLIDLLVEAEGEANCSENGQLALFGKISGQ